VAKKLNSQFLLLYLRYMWRGGSWLKMSYMGVGGGWLKSQNTIIMGKWF